MGKVFLDKEIYDHFTKNVGDYDTVSNKVVIENDELHNHLVDAITFDTCSPLKILDLGSGTGHGMSLMLKKFPNSHVTGIDFSDKMIRKSKENLKKFKDKVTLTEANFNDIDFEKQYYDVIVSVIAIHNATHEEKAKLFKKISEALKDGGLFINADFVEGETNDENRIYQDTYKNFLERNLEGEELKTWLNHAFNEDKPLKLSDQLQLLEEQFSQEIDVLWQVNNQILYRAIKA